MSSAQYRRITEAIGAILEDVHEDPGTKTCTLAFLAFDGPFTS